MARTAEGWTVKPHRGIYHVRFRLQGKRHRVTTGERDPVKAAQIAPQIYADFVSGSVKRAASGALIHPGTQLDVLAADWIVDILPELGQGTQVTYEVYARHWSEHFKTIGNVRSSGIGSYQRWRLGSVQRTSVIKERGALRRFLTWCVEKEMLREVPEFPALPKKATGKKHRQARSVPMVDLSPADVEAILAALPELSLRAGRVPPAKPRGGRAQKISRAEWLDQAPDFLSPDEVEQLRGGATNRFPVRAYFVLIYETMLRPEGTIDRLIGRDLTLAGLHIRPECDKNRWERVVPLSDRARAAFESLGPLEPDAPIFGNNDRRVVWRKACLAALGERGRRVTPYDLKHAMATHLSDAGAPVTGIVFRSGTKSALHRYVHPSRRAAESTFGLLSGSMPPAASCEGRDLNPDESYLASTSSKSVSAKHGKSGPFVEPDPSEFTASMSLLGSGSPKEFLEKSRGWFAKGAA